MLVVPVFTFAVLVVSVLTFAVSFVTRLLPVIVEAMFDRHCGDRGGPDQRESPKRRRHDPFVASGRLVGFGHCGVLPAATRSSSFAIACEYSTSKTARSASSASRCTRSTLARSPSP